MSFLGIDTSNYTTSAALYDERDGIIRMEKQPLPTAPGALGLRQSDAVFSHVKQLGEVIEGLFAGIPEEGPVFAVGVSAFPRREKGSYMPCFLVGETAARSCAAAMGVPCFRFSHQEGHIMAALYGAGKMEWLSRPFLAFHLSGGTTDGLLVTPSGENPAEGCPFQIRQAASSLDLKAGQAVDRVGLMLGIPFPCGQELTRLAEAWQEPVQAKAVMKGADCCLSGIENQCAALKKAGSPPERIARFCLESIYADLAAMTRALLKEYGSLPLLYAGGVMSSTIIRRKMEKEFGGVFADPSFSSDNGAGAAVLAALAYRRGEL